MDRLSADGNDTVISLASWQTMGYDQHSLISTPAQLFANPGANDYHLSTTSPALNKGTFLSDVPDDLEGRSRPAGIAFDIGAYETPGLLPYKLYLPAELKT